MPVVGRILVCIDTLITRGGPTKRDRREIEKMRR